MEKKFLATTPDTRTWPQGKEIYFLSNNYLKYEEMKLDQAYKAVHFLHYTNSERLIEINQREINRINNDFFPKLVELLNKFHNSSFSTKFWKILIGPWFQYQLIRLVSQKNDIDNAIKYNEIDSAIFLKLDNTNLIPRDFNDNWKLHRRSSYLSHIDMMLTSSLKNTELKIKEINAAHFPVIDESEEMRKKVNFEIKKLPVRVLNLISNHLVLNKNAYISSTYLPISKEIKLQLSFAQFPIMWRNYLEYEEMNKPDLMLRINNSKYLDEKFGLDIIEKLLVELIPVCYLEGFSELRKSVENSNLPKNPKFIFTSNDFNAFEKFKMYAALNAEIRSNYFIGQHGNNYGTFNAYLPLIEEQTPNKFITWGWKSHSNTHVSGFNLKNVGRKFTSNPEGGLLSVQYPLQINPMEINPFFNSELYLRDQFKFINELNPKIQKSLTVRLSSTTEGSLDNEKRKFMDSNPDINVDQGMGNYLNALSKNRLAVFSYDSTGLLENLSANIPTLAFWQFGLNHVNDDARAFYELLKDCGIIFFDPISAAQKINSIWDDVSSWWNSTDIQKARISFCNCYSRKSRRPVRDLRRIIRENI